MKLISQIGALAATAFLLSACDKTSTTASTYSVPPPTPTVGATVEPPSATQATVTPAPPKSPWNYSESTDKMTGVTSYHASVDSLNTVNLDFPYSGEQRASLLITSSGVILYVKKGQVTCGSIRGGCRILAKFDDSKAEYEDWYSIGDDSTTVSVRGESFLTKLYKAKKLVVRLDFYQNGFHDFEFDVSDLKPIKKSKTA